MVYDFRINCQLMTKKEPIETFGQLIQRYLRIRGISQAELSRKARVSANYISLLKRDKSGSGKGKPKPAVEVVDKIAKHLGIPLAVARAANGYAGPNEMTAEATFLEMYEELKRKRSEPDIDPEFAKTLDVFVEMLLERIHQEQRKRK